MVKIIATRPVPYGKQRYNVGDEFDATPKDARLLVAIGKARPADQGSPTDLPKVPPAPQIDIAALRGEYETVVGKRPFGGWTPEELRGRMAAHQAGQTYNRRDMRAKK